MIASVLEGLGVDRRVRRAVRPLWPEWRRANRAQEQEFARVLGGRVPAHDYKLDAYPRSRTLLVVGYGQTEMASVQSPVILAARMAGYRVVLTLPAAHFAAASFYRAIGVNEILETDTLRVPLPRGLARRMVTALSTPADLLALSHDGVPVGKFAASSLMRQTRAGHIDPADPAIQPKLVDALAASLRAAGLARKVLDRSRPELVIFYDRGYTPEGELFELALAEGARAITTNTAHKSGYLLLKAYDESNKDAHPGSLAPSTWQKLSAMPWSAREWDRLRGELTECYQSGLWYDEVGTQFNKRMIDRAELVSSLALDPSKRTAVIFPHLFWDATFFWGTDLFDDYRDWFVQALRAAAANPALNWIVKVHPANIVKNARDKYQGEYSEMIAIRETLGELPPHIRLIAPDSPISTFSLYDVMDYCLTVRGTVGLEAAIFGKQVLTAGTGRYDGYGFTIDSTSREEYLARLATLQTTPPPTAEQTERARRYAYGLFLERPLRTDSLSFRYGHDGSATLRTALTLPASGRLEDSADLRILSAWLADPSVGDLSGDAAAQPSAA
jgi:hypothetical protein